MYVADQSEGKSDEEILEKTKALCPHVTKGDSEKHFATKESLDLEKNKTSMLVGLTEC